MLTTADRAVREQTGLVTPDRLRALAYALDHDAADARAAAHAEGIDERLAAALRGKSIAYREAAAMARSLLAGNGLRPRRWSTARRRAVEYRQRQAARRG